MYNRSLIGIVKGGCSVFVRFPGRGVERVRKALELPYLRVNSRDASCISKRAGRIPSNGAGGAVRQIQPWRLWVGDRGDVREPARLVRAGIEAVVDLALEELPIALPREVVSCRFPLVDGAGNERGLVRAAVEAVAGLVNARVATLVVCSAGMSRSPSVAAGAMARVTGRAAAECLGEVTNGFAADVSPGLWGEVLAAVAAGRNGVIARNA